MLGKIEEIIDNRVKIQLSIDISEQPNLINLHVVFEDNRGKKIVGEIAEANKEIMIVNIVGEINNGVFLSGVGLKPSFK